jgi:hypothetical protein
MTHDFQMFSPDLSKLKTIPDSTIETTKSVRLYSLTPQYFLNQSQITFNAFEGNPVYVNLLNNRIMIDNSGMFYITFSCSMNGANSSRKIVDIKKNNATIITMEHGVDSVSCNFSQLFYCNRNDFITVELELSNNSGINITNASLSAFKVQ